jgi:uncharacterized DUF497 family protein
MPASPYSAREFEWDQLKNELNTAKHGLSFEEAVLMFDGPLLLKVDDRREYGEKRIKALGVIGEDIYHVVYTERGARIRIISARKANREERRAYRAAWARGRA